MDKKIAVVLFFLIAFFGISFYLMNMSNDKNKKEEANSNTSNNTEVIENINNVELYITDFKYDEKINGYQYEKVELTDEQINSFKKNINKIDLNDKNDRTVYGKYKLVIDDKVIFFDPNNDYGLYMNNSTGITVSRDIKNILVKNEKLCSCCINSNCNINLCSCN